MKKALFYVFLFVFASTAILTLLGITNVITIQTEYLNKLFYALIVESIAPVIALFKRTNFFDDKKENKLNIILLPQEDFTRNGDPHLCKVKIYNQIEDTEQETEVTLRRENGYLSAYMDIINDNDLIKVIVENSNNKKWSSQYFNPSTAKAEMEII